MPRVSPCERTIEIIIPAANNAVIDLFQCLSMQNRKAYRQCNELGIQTVEIYGTDPNASGYVGIQRLPNTWVLVNSIVKARAEWLEQQNDLLRDTDGWSSVAKYRDFKMYFNQYHATGVAFDGTAVVTILPNGFMDRTAAQAVDPGAGYEWEYSKIAIPNFAGVAGNSVDVGLHALGDDNLTTSAGVITAYAESRSRPHPTDPSGVDTAGLTSTTGGIYSMMDDLGEINENLQDAIRHENDQPPYVVGGVDSLFEFYPGGSQNPVTNSDEGVLVDKLFLRGGTALASDQTGPFSAHLGLLWFNNAYIQAGSGALASVQARIVVMPGDHHGVMARDMKDVN